MLKKKLKVSKTHRFSERSLKILNDLTSVYDQDETFVIEESLFENWKRVRNLQSVFPGDITNYIREDK